MKKSVFLHIFIFILLINLSYSGVPDQDLDGVPDLSDKCPNSETNVLDQFGCSCAQKNCVSDSNPCTNDCGEISGLATCNAPNNDSCPGGYCSNGVCVTIICPSPPLCPTQLIYGDPHPDDPNQCPTYICQTTSNQTIPTNQTNTTLPINETVFCGNGVLDVGEQCDDANTRNDDGCSSTCQEENNQTTTSQWVTGMQTSACGEKIKVTTNGDIQSVGNILDNYRNTYWIRNPEDYLIFDFGCKLQIQKMYIFYYWAYELGCEIFISDDNTDYTKLMEIDPPLGNANLDVLDEGRYLKYQCKSPNYPQFQYLDIYFFTTLDKSSLPPRIVTYNTIDYVLKTDGFNPQFLITDADGVNKTSINLKILEGDGIIVKQLRLFDDGLHSDVLANDDIYGASVSLSDVPEGTYIINVEASDTLGNIKNVDAYKIPIIESLAHCLDVIPNHNDMNDNNRINVIFTMIGGNRDINIQKENAASVVNEGFKVLQPFKSEINKFNFFFVDVIGNLADPGISEYKEIDRLASKCPYRNEFTINWIARSSQIGIYGNRALMYDINRPLNKRIVFDDIKGEMHEFGHSFGKLLDEYGYYSSNDTIGISRKNCYFASSINECLRNAPWSYLVGQGCGDQTKIDCNTNDSKYDFEIGCFLTCGGSTNVFRSTNNNMMNVYGSEYGLWNEKLICDEIKKFYGNMSNYCKSIQPTSFQVCGNGIIEGTEECDGVFLYNESTCASLGFNSGTLNCTSNCKRDTSGCIASSNCGNNVIDSDEQCDDGNTVDGDGCSATCQNEAPQPTCADCGNGLFNICDKEECLSLGNCEFVDGFLVNDCKNSSPPLVYIKGAPDAWTNKAIEATIVCSDDESGCNKESYKHLENQVGLDLCPRELNYYTPGSSVTLTNHAWLCGYAEDSAGNEGFSEPVQFLVDTTKPEIVVFDAPQQWTPNPVTAYISCFDGESDCDYSSLRYKMIITSILPECPTNANEYEVGSSVTVSYYAWLCGYGKDNAGNEAFSDPVEFKVGTTE